MKFGKVGPVGLVRHIGPIGKTALVSAIALGVATLFTACTSTLTVGFLFVSTTRQSPGQVAVYEVNSESGGLRNIPTSPFPSGGRNPVAMVTDPVSYKNLYVVNKDDNNIVQFGIGTDGKLYPQSTVNTPGSFPFAVAINAAGKYLYVLDTLRPVPGCSLTNPCPGAVAVYPVNADGSLGLNIANAGNPTYSNYWPLFLSSSDSKTVLTPTAVTVLPNGNSVYVSAYDANTGKGYLFAFAANSDGSLTPLNGGNPLSIGAQPFALASDASSNYLYVVDKLAGTISSFATASLNAGSATLLSTADTGSQPSALTVDGSSFIYVANAGDSSVTGYSIASGVLARLTTNTSDTNPIAITVDPRNLGFLYTVNFLGSSLSGYKIDSTSGSLINAQKSPYGSTVQPTAIAGVPHGGTATAVTGK